MFIAFLFIIEESENSPGVLRWKNGYINCCIVVKYIQQNERISKT